MKKIFLITLIFIVQNTFSQINFKGIVKDSIGNVLELANVIAINQETKALESYAITDENGEFTLVLGKNGKYNLQISYIGKKKFEQIISTLEDTI